MSTKEHKEHMERRDFLKVAGAAAGVAALGLGVEPALAATATAGVATRAGTPDALTLWFPGSPSTVKSWASDPILQAVEQATNTRITITQYSFDHYTDHINTAIASGTVPDIIAGIFPGNDALIARLVRDRIVAPFEGAVGAAAPLLLSEYRSSRVYDELRGDGKIYQWPIGWNAGTGPDSTLHIRKDLLDKLGLSLPDTFGQYFAFLTKAKAHGATGVIFDGAGTGGSASGLGHVMSPFAGAYGLPWQGWIRVKGGFAFAQTQPGMKKALLLFRAMVAAGLVDPASWSDTNTSRDKYVAGEGAALMFNGGGHVGRIQNDMDLGRKGYKDYMLPALSNGTGARGYTAIPNFYGTTLVGNLGGNNPVAAARVLNYLASDAGTKLTAFGIPGRDYTMVDGRLKLLPQRAKDGFAAQAGDTGAHPLATPIVSWVPQSLQDEALLYGHGADFRRFYDQAWVNQRRYQTPAYGLVASSPLWAKFEPTSIDLATRTFLQIVRSDSDKQASDLFDGYVSQWMSQGGAEAQAEMSGLLSSLYR